MKHRFDRFGRVALLASGFVFPVVTAHAQQSPTPQTQAPAKTLPAVANPITVSVVTDRANALYSVGERANFSINAKADGMAVPTGEVSYQLSLDGVGDLGKGTLTLQNGVAAVSGTLDKPGVLRCSVSFIQNDKKGAGMAAAAFEPFKIQPTATVPADFEEFWNQQKVELAAIAPDVQLELISQPNNDIETYKISLANINGSRVRGYFSRPKAGGPHPAILQVPGAGVRPPWAGYVSAQAAKGFIAMDLSIHDIPLDETPEFYTQLANGALKGYPAFGREDRTTYYFRRVILGCLRAVDYLTSRPEWDKRHMIVNGSSQGGALSIITAGLDSRVTALAANVPAMCDHTGRAFGRPSGWPQLIPLDTNGKLNPQIAAVSAYYDVVNFARRIRIPAVMGVGLIDTTCPPTTNFSAYNVLQGPKQIDIAPLMGHDFSKSYVELSARFIADQVAQKKAN